MEHDPALTKAPVQDKCPDCPSGDTGQAAQRDHPDGTGSGHVPQGSAILVAQAVTVPCFVLDSLGHRMSGARGHGGGVPQIDYILR
jgi:hypothetical protein